MKNKKFITSIIICAVLLILSIILAKPTIKKLNFGLDLKGGFEVLYLVESLEGEKTPTNEEVSSTYKAIRNRIDTLGVSEPEITIEGDKIRVKLPGVTDEAQARERLSTPAVLTFRNTSNEELMTGAVLDTPGAKLDYDRNTNLPVVALSIKDNDKFYNVTRRISESNDQLITIWLDFEEGDTYSKEECGKSGNKKCISAATVKEAFANNVIIQGNFTEAEAKELVDLINSGSLPTKISEISTKTVDASFGEETLNNVVIAGIITLLVIILIMTFFYRISGFISSICLLAYTVIVFILFSLIDGVLTLTGIAALILGIGMAIDSSIITLEKIKEELANGKKLTNAYKDGNKRSIVSLIDANITTFLAALILFIFGESSVKGFATMLILTIIVTCIAMVLINRFIMTKIIESKVLDGKEKLFIGPYKKNKTKNYLKASKVYMYTISIIILIGLIMTCIKGLNLGIDFKGGSSVSLISEDKIDENQVNDILKKYEIVEQTKISDTENYYKLEKTLSENEVKEVKNALNELNIKSDISVISNIVKKDLTKNALISLAIASIVILLYIKIRFTTNYAIGAIISVLSDVLVTISIFAILRIEINFIFIAGILTIIGYSINDTIVVFDIAREKVNSLKNKTEETLTNVVKESISFSMKRNILTSITTLTAIITLLALSTTGVKEFNITVLIGLLAGTFSSLLLALYVWLKLEIHSIKHPKQKKDDDDEDYEKLIKGINS